MKDLATIPYNVTAERLVSVLCEKTQTDDALFFRIMVSYYFAKIASMMRTNIDTHDRGRIPINLYAINLATSGHGKGHSTNIVEEQVIGEFREVFMETTLPEIARQNLSQLAVKRAIRKNEDDEVALARLEKEYEGLGEFAFSFDSGTPAAVKQMRHMLLMADCGSMNLEIDEIGANLMGNVDVLTTFLELFDVGKVKQKITKNTAENTRNEEIIGRTPTNMMLYGTPTKLLDGGKTELEYDGFIDMGYGRRCFFGYTEPGDYKIVNTPEELYKRAINKTADTFLVKLSDDFAQLADINNFGKTLYMEEATAILTFEYKQDCEIRANKFRVSDSARKAEMSHRFFKALKLAGAYAFIEGSAELTEDHFYQAIKVAEDSGDAFNRMLTRDRNYVKLAKFIASEPNEVTGVDISEALPLFKGGENVKRDMMTQAIAWGYKNNRIIKKTFVDSIEFFKGETLDKTNLSKCRLSYSSKMAADYAPREVPFTKMCKLTQKQGKQWCNHHFLSEHRTEENAIPGFNFIVLDVDEGCDIPTARLLLNEYTYHLYTTKRHQQGSHGDRFRILIPMSHTLKMTADEYKEFMNNVYEWLPFGCDTGTNQRCKKWMSHKGIVYDNIGQSLDVLNFIPKTSRCEAQKKVIDSQQSMNNLERWFANNTGTGNRSNQLIKFAMMLVDSGQGMAEVRTRTLELNAKLPEPMKEAEIDSTIMQTAAKAIQKRTP